MAMPIQKRSTSGLGSTRDALKAAKPFPPQRLPFAASLAKPESGRYFGAVTELFSPGDVYEDVFYHPCLALGVNYDDDEIWGISLIDGSYPRSMSLAHNDIRKINLNEVWELKQRHTRNGGRDGWWATETPE